MVDLESNYYSLQDYDGEVWKPLCNGYEISNMGRVKSLYRVIVRADGRNRTIRERILRPAVGTNGYLHVQAPKNVTLWIHRAVAELFCDGFEQGLVVDHINCNKHDNRSCNLRWVTNYENVHRASFGKPRDNHLEKNPKSKIVFGILNGEIVEVFNCAKKISLKYGINYSTLRKGLQKDNMVINNISYHYQNNLYET